jgi:cobalt/nickel transport system ATP-binding protein
MGTRAKQQAENSQIPLDFTYGVIDKCILKALLGEDSLVLTTGSMVDRVHKRVDDYGKESGIHITVTPLEPGNVTTNKGSGSRI